MFLSEGWIELQRLGWKFVRIFEPNKEDIEIPDDGNEYDIQFLENKWGDSVLFIKLE